MTFYSGHADKYLARRLTSIIDLVLQKNNDMYTYDILTGSKWYNACFHKGTNEDNSFNIFADSRNVKFLKCYNGNNEPFKMAYILTIERDSLILKNYFKDLVDSVAMCLIGDNCIPVIAILSHRLKEYIERLHTVNYWSEHDLINAAILLGEYDRTLYQIACHEVRHIFQKFGVVTLKDIETTFLNPSHFEYPDKYVDWVAETWLERHGRIFYRYCSQSPDFIAKKMTAEEDAFITECLADSSYCKNIKNKDWKNLWLESAKIVKV